MGEKGVAAKFLLDVATQWIRVNVFGSEALCSVLAIHPSASSRLPHPDPVRGPVASATESLCVH